MKTTSLRTAVCVFLSLVSLTACQGKASQCRELGNALSQGGDEMAAKAKGKADNDPALGNLLDDYATRLRAIQVTDAKLVSGRDEYAKALQDQATATRAWQAATTPAAKATASAQMKAARADQDRLGAELLAACK